VLICFNAALIILNAGLFRAAPEYFLSPQTLLWYFTESRNIWAVFWDGNTREVCFIFDCTRRFLRISRFYKNRHVRNKTTHRRWMLSATNAKFVAFTITQPNFRHVWYVTTSDNRGGVQWAKRMESSVHANWESR